MPKLQSPPTAQAKVLDDSGHFTADWYLFLAGIVFGVLKAPAGATQPPATSTSAGSFGQIALDGNFVYFCIANNSWKRIALTAF